MTDSEIEVSRPGHVHDAGEFASPQFEGEMPLPSSMGG